MIALLGYEAQPLSRCKAERLDCRDERGTHSPMFDAPVDQRSVALGILQARAVGGVALGVKRDIALAEKQVPQVADAPLCAERRGILRSFRSRMRDISRSPAMLRSTQSHQTACWSSRTLT
jgi:hypothetical protein